jgi:integrase
MARRTDFGTVEQLKSGNYRARYTHPLTGERRSAQVTFSNKTDAKLWLSNERVSIEQGTWRDMRKVTETLDEYGLAWIEQRELKTATRDDYLAQWRVHVSPFIGSVRLVDLTTEKVRAWQTNRIQAGAGKSSIAYTYRVISAVCNTAVENQILRSNPCQIKGASRVRPAKRKTLTVEQVIELTNVIAPRYKALVHMLVWSGLRIGETTALRRSDLQLDSDYPNVSVSRRVKANRSGGGFNWDTPKTDAGVRTVALPQYVVPILQNHLNQFVEPGDESLVFATSLGNPAVCAGSDAIRTALRSIGCEHLTAHDLRGTHATLARELGATDVQVRDRLGQSSLQATAIYMHGTDRGDREIADRMGKLAEQIDNVVPFKSRVS